MKWVKALFMENLGTLVLVSDIILLKGEIKEPVTFSCNIGNIGCAIYVLQEMNTDFTISDIEIIK